VPEFDMPGAQHRVSWDIRAGPAEKALTEIERRWVIFDPAIDPTNEKVYKLLDDLMVNGEDLPRSLLSYRRDEVNGKEWDANPKIRRT